MFGRDYITCTVVAMRYEHALTRHGDTRRHLENQRVDKLQGRDRSTCSPYVLHHVSRQLQFLGAP